MAHQIAKLMIANGRMPWLTKGATNGFFSINRPELRPMPVVTTSAVLQSAKVSVDCNVAHPLRQSRLSASKVRAGNTIQRDSYDPLHDDAQAMALVKKMGLDILRGSKEWSVGEAMVLDNEGIIGALGMDKDLNRAVCLCVAKMQKAKNG